MLLLVRGYRPQRALIAFCSDFLCVQLRLAVQSKQQKKIIYIERERVMREDCGFNERWVLGCCRA